MCYLSPMDVILHYRVGGQLFTYLLNWSLLLGLEVLGGQKAFKSSALVKTLDLGLKAWSNLINIYILQFS